MPAFRRVLVKRLAEQPAAVIGDLSGLRKMDPSCAAVFTSVVSHPSSSWPATNLVVCGAHGGAAECRPVGTVMKIDFAPRVDRMCRGAASGAAWSLMSAPDYTKVLVT